MQTDERATAGQQVDACLLSTAGDVGAAGWRDGSYGNEQCVGKSTCASAGWIAPLRVRERARGRRIKSKRLCQQPLLADGATCPLRLIDSDAH